jgi:PAS domain-containing protein
MVKKSVSSIEERWLGAVNAIIKREKLKQKTMALELDISHCHFNGVLKGRRPLTTQMMDNVSAYLGKTTGELVGIEQPGKINGPGSYNNPASVVAQVMALSVDYQRIESENIMLKRTLNHISDGVSIQNRRLEIEYQNQTLVEMAGGNFVGQRCYESYSNEKKPCSNCPVLKSFNDGKSHTIIKEGLDGVVRRLTSTPLRNSVGEIDQVVETAEDITELHNETERALRQVTRMQMIADRSKEGISITVGEGRVVYRNEAYYTLIGDELREADDTPKSKEVYRKLVINAEEVIGAWVESLETGEEKEITFDMKDGRFVRASIYPMLEGKTKAGMVVFAREIAQDWTP